MSSAFALLLAVASFSVIQCRVTFTNSEVLQQQDLDKTTKSAPFKCANGCKIYSDSQSADMYITDGVKDLNNFLVMAGKPVEIPCNTCRIEYRGNGAAPTFVFYAVDKKFASDAPVVAMNGVKGYIAHATDPRYITLLRSTDGVPSISFDGNIASGYPRIYTTGYDAAAEVTCKPVYQARSQTSALNSVLSIDAPILTIDMGPTTAKSAHTVASEAFENKAVNSSVVGISPGYVGCTYTSEQMYQTNNFFVVETFSSEAKTLDIETTLFNINSQEAVHINVNEEKLNIAGASPNKQHREADRFDVTIDWSRITFTSNFAVQFDLGVTPAKVQATTAKSEESTTSGSVKQSFIISFLLVLAVVTMQ